MSSSLGSIIDPLADKILVSCVAIPLAVKGILPLWLVGLVVGRDMTLVSGAVLLRRVQLQRNMNSVPIWTLEPTPLSKCNTVLQIVLLGCSLCSEAWQVYYSFCLAVCLYISFSLPSLRPPKLFLCIYRLHTQIPPSFVLEPLLFLVAGSTVLSGVDYCLIARRHLLLGSTKI